MKLEMLVIFLGMLINVAGTVIWIQMYRSGMHTEWWAIGLMILCGLSALILTSRFVKIIYSQIVGR